MEVSPESAFDLAFSSRILWYLVMKRRCASFGLRWGRRLCKDQRGDVLLEYVLINAIVILSLIGVSSGIINPTGTALTMDETLDGDNYGLLGNGMVEAYRRILSGVALPVP